MLKTCALNSISRRTLLLLFFILVFQGNFGVYALKPTVVTGVFGEYRVQGEEIEGTADLGMHGLFSYRTLLAHRGYAAASASVMLSGLAPGSDLHDIETLHVLVSTPAGNNRLEVSGGIAASLAGIDDSGWFALPEWKVLYRLERGRRSIRPYGSYNGYIIVHEPETGNRYYNGIEAGLMHAPRVELEYRGSIRTGIEKWMNQERRDLVSGVNLQIHGLLGYFMNWKFTGNGEYRASSDASQDSVAGFAAAELGWSPSRRLTMTARTGFTQEFYLEANESDHTVTYALRMDYMALDRIYLFVENNASWQNPFSDSSGTWNFQLKAGMDISMVN